MHSPVREISEQQRQDAADVFWRWVDAGKEKDRAPLHRKTRNERTLSPGLANIVLLVLKMQQTRKDAAERRVIAQHALLLAEEESVPEELEEQARALEREADKLGEQIKTLMDALGRSLRKDDFGLFFHCVVAEIVRPSSGRSASEVGLIGTDRG